MKDTLFVWGGKLVDPDHIHVVADLEKSFFLPFEGDVKSADELNVRFKEYQNELSEVKSINPKNVEELRDFFSSLDESLLNGGFPQEHEFALLFNAGKQQFENLYSCSTIRSYEWSDGILEESLLEPIEPYKTIHIQSEDVILSYESENEVGKKEYKELCRILSIDGSNTDESLYIEKCIHKKNSDALGYGSIINEMEVYSLLKQNGIEENNIHKILGSEKTETDEVVAFSNEEDEIEY